MNFSRSSPKLLAQSRELIGHIEQAIFAFYDLKPALNAGEFLISERLLQDFLETYQSAERAKLTPSRAGVWLFRENDDEVFVGIHFRKDLLEQINRINPLEKLTHQNLDSFCVFVEEVSHFHLLNQRIMQSRSVSQLELEWQGEIDKALLAGALLKEQAGDPHLRILARKIYDDANFIADEPAPHYEAANHYAGKFWYNAIAQGIGETISLYDREFVNLLRENYNKPIEEKFPFSAYLKSS